MGRAGFYKDKHQAGSGVKKEISVVFLDIVGAAITYWAEKRTAGTFVFMAVGYSSVSSETSKGVSTVLTRDWVQTLLI